MYCCSINKFQNPNKLKALYIVTLKAVSVSACCFRFSSFVLMRYDISEPEIDEVHGIRKYCVIDD
jgi:hypothetical protein